MTAPALSFVVPLKDEQATIAELYRQIAESTAVLQRSFEIIFVDDGSEDASWDEVRALSAADPERVRGMRFRRNLGKASALAAGFRAARADIVFTMDADLQDDPTEIGRFLDKLAEGYDIVGGWKKVRHDPWHKVLPSRVFNAMLSVVSKTPLHDHNCGFKCYRASVVGEVALYGEMHRMIPALGTMRGFRSTEIEVQHHPRRFGRSKYGIRRFLRGFMDMLTIGFLHNFRERPLHLLGGLALTLVSLGVAAIAIGHAAPLGAHDALSLQITGASLIAGGVPLMGIGFLAELITYRSPPPHDALPIVESLPDSEVIVGTSLALLEGSGPGPSRGQARAVAADDEPTSSARVA